MAEPRQIDGQAAIRVHQSLGDVAPGATRTREVVKEDERGRSASAVLEMHSGFIHGVVTFTG